jgi:hypothetical protein
LRYDEAFNEFNKKTSARTLTKGFDVIMSRKTSKKNKHDLNKLKSFINKLK